MELSTQIRTARQIRGLSQTEAAEQMGISQPALARIESGRHPPKQETIERAADWIMGKQLSKTLKSNPAKPLKTPRVPGRRHNEVAESSLFFRGFAADDQSPRANTLGIQSRRFDKVARFNPRIKNALRMINDATFWSEARLVPDEDQDYQRDPEYRVRDAVLIDMITRQFKRMRTPNGTLRASLRSFLQMAMTVGFAVAEKVWESRGGVWELVALKVKQSWDFHPWVDTFGNLIGLFHFPTGRIFSPDRFLFGVWPYLHGENYLGFSEIEAIEQDIETYNLNRKSRNRFIQKRAIAPWLHRYSYLLSPEQITAVKKAVNEMASLDVYHSMTMIDPMSGKVIPMSDISAAPDTANQALLNQMSQAIDEEAKEITRASGIPDTLGVTETRSGSFALGRMQFDSFMARPENSGIWISDHMECQVIKDVVWYNFPEYVLDERYLLPRYTFKQIDEESAEREAETIRKDLDAQIISLEEARILRGYGQRDAPDSAEG